MTPADGAADYRGVAVGDSRLFLNGAVHGSSCLVLVRVECGDCIDCDRGLAACESAVLDGIKGHVYSYIVVGS